MTRKPLELDAEGVAYADGFFYVIGSQGRARHEDNAGKEAKNAAKATAARKVFKIALAADAVDLATGTLRSLPTINTSVALATVLQKDPVLAPFFDRPLEKNGLTVEGIAVRGGKSLCGHARPGPRRRSGGDRARASGHGLRRRAGCRDALSLDARYRHPGRPTRHPRHHHRGRRVPADRRPENDPPKKHPVMLGDYAVYAWNEGAAVKRLDLQPTGKKAKPEALVVLDQDRVTAHALLLFDGPKEGQPTPVDIPLK